MHDFTFNGVSLRSLGGRITEAPFHTVASRDVEQVKIYGQSGDEVIDNQSYNNVPFTVKIAFLTYKTSQTANDIARAVIDWLAPLQGAYYTYTDTWNTGYFTKARLTNFDEVKRELRTLLTATLKFSRVPFWYNNSGTTAVTQDSSGNVTLTNPEIYSAEPIVTVEYTGTAANNYKCTISIASVSVYVYSGGVTPYQVLDGVQKQHYKISNNTKEYISNTLPPELPPNRRFICAARLEGSSIWGRDVQLSIIPNWRRL